MPLLIKRTDERPADLVKIVKKVAEFPDSLRLAEELYDIGIPLLKKEGLWIPMIPYNARLMFAQKDSDYCGMYFERGFQYDIMKAVVSNEGSADAIEVLREREWNFVLSPIKCRVFEFNTLGEICGSRQYDLNGD